MATKLPAWRYTLARWAYSRSYFPQLGLMRDDVLYENNDVEEALRRLPKNQMAERSFRISRAMLLSTKKHILPKDEWTKFDEDELYLQPYIEQVAKERKEREEWGKK